MIITENQHEENRVNLTLDMSQSEFNELFVRCHDCGRIVPASDEDGMYYEDRYYCSHCISYCEHCGEMLPTYRTYSVEDSSALFCHSCYYDHTFSCDCCGHRFYYEDSLHYDDGEDLCDDCYDSRESALDDYHSFKDYGNILFCGNEPRRNAPYMGYELEVDAHKSVSLKPVIEGIRDIIGYDYYHYEHDGSLNYGFEMISQPCSLSYHLSKIEEHKRVFKKLIESDLRGHDIAHCGLHIHIDKQFFGNSLDSSIAKLLYLFEKFSSELLLFSRRTPAQISSWCRFRKDENTKNGWIKSAVKDAKGYLQHGERYHAINLCNSETIEIRLWRSTLNIESFVATLKLTDRLARIVKDTRAVDLARMSFLDLLGDDEDVLRYWSRIQNRNTESEDE